MNEVQPIRDIRHVNAMKKAMHGRDLLLFIFGINSGLRVSDILKLKVGDVRGQDSIILNEQKTSKAKRFILNRSIKEAVEKLIPAEATDNEYLFRSRKGENKPITRTAAYRILNAAAKRAGIDDKIGALGTHSMRKTFGYFAYEAGTDLALLQSIFNHSSQADTLKYIGINQDQVDTVYANINL